MALKIIIDGSSLIVLGHLLLFLAIAAVFFWVPFSQVESFPYHNQFFVPLICDVDYEYSPVRSEMSPGMDGMTEELC